MRVPWISIDSSRSAVLVATHSQCDNASALLKMRSLVVEVPIITSRCSMQCNITSGARSAVLSDDRARYFYYQTLQDLVAHDNRGRPLSDS